MKTDELFVNGVLGWLEDMEYVTPELSLEQLESVLEAQQEWGTRFPFYTEMKRVATTMRRMVEVGKAYKTTTRLRVGRAADRCGVDTEFIGMLRDRFRKHSANAKRNAEKRGLRLETNPMFVRKTASKGKPTQRAKNANK